MANRPALQPTGKLTPRDRIWAEVRAIGVRGFGVCVVDIHDRTGINQATIYTYLDALRKGGFLAGGRQTRSGEQLQPGQRRRGKQGLSSRFAGVRFTLVRDVGVEAPRVDRSGKPLPETAWAKVWRAMKALKVFDYRELAHCARAGEDKPTDGSVKVYCHYLAFAGYIKTISGGRGNVPARYRFARDTGARAPEILKVRHVYDPNLGEVVWHPEANA